MSIVRALRKLVGGKRPLCRGDGAQAKLSLECTDPTQPCRRQSREKLTKRRSLILIHVSLAASRGYRFRNFLQDDAREPDYISRRRILWHPFARKSWSTIVPTEFGTRCATSAH